MNPHIDESDIESDVEMLLRSAAPSTVRRLDHPGLQRRGRRRRFGRQAASIGVALGGIVAVLVVAPFAGERGEVGPVGESEQAGGGEQPGGEQPGDGEQSRGTAQPGGDDPHLQLELAAGGCPEPYEHSGVCLDPALRPEAPEPDLPWLDRANGGPTDLAALRGQTVVLSGWAEWCDPCLDEQAEVRRLVEEAISGVSFVGVAVAMPDADVEAFVEQHAITHPQLIDVDGDYLPELHHLSGVDPEGRWGPLPATFVLDADGRLAAWTWGQVTEARLRALIEYVAEDQ